MTADEIRAATDDHDAVNVAMDGRRAVEDHQQIELLIGSDGGRATGEEDVARVVPGFGCRGNRDEHDEGQEHRTSDAEQAVHCVDLLGSCRPGEMPGGDG